MKLKKGLIFIIAVFSFLLNIGFVNAEKVNVIKSGYYYERNGNGYPHSSDSLKFYTIDGKIAYCIEPYVHEGKEIYEGKWEDTKLPDAIKERIMLITYYGYTYPDHQTLKFRMATQAMLWETIMGEGSFVNIGTYYWSSGLIDLSKEKNEIEKLIANHTKKPSFDNKVFVTQGNKEIILEDKNNILQEYSIEIIGGQAEYNINGNLLTIVPKSMGQIDVKLTKKQYYTEKIKLFVGNEIQNMILPGTVDPSRSYITIVNNPTTVTGHKVDSETGSNSQGQASLKGAIYGVYENSSGKLVETVTTDENGYFTISSLEWNDYYLQEIKPSNGYLLDNTKYNFSTKNQNEVYIEMKEQVIKNYVSILKQYEHVEGETKFLNAEEGITFEIYHSNGKKFDEIITDKNGYACINLPYGVWRFHQVNTTSGYEKIYDFYITVSETSEKEHYYNILNNSLSAYLQVIKVDEETGKTIAIADTTFKIFNTDTNQYVSQFVGGKVISEFKTDEKGILVTPLKLQAGNYKLIEVSAPNGYLKDKDGLKFTIGDDTHYNYTTYGAFITVTYKNTPIKGQIEIHKVGEDLIIKDGEYIYAKKKLSGVTFEIYAAEDILSSDKNNLYYEKDQLVDTIITDENGYAKSKRLPLGKYYLKEVRTQEDYVLDENEHYFTLKQVDDETPIVYESYSALNYLKKGTIEFTKTDLVNGEVIPDTIIEIYTNKDELIFTGKTDKDGKIVIDNLKVGKYYIIEKEPSTGYLITTEKVYFELKENGEIVKANMTNKKITSIIKIHKVDENGNSLVGVKIGIFDLDGNLIYSELTNKNGDIELELEYGSYYFQELETIENYVLNDEKVYFEVTEEGALIEHTLINEKSKIDVPNTLSNSYITLISTCIILLGTSLIIISLKKKRK